MVTLKEIERLNKKCIHDKCKRKADYKDNKYGYCNKCIQLNTKICQFCLQ